MTMRIRCTQTRNAAAMVCEFNTLETTLAIFQACQLFRFGEIVQPSILVRLKVGHDIIRASGVDTRENCTAYGFLDHSLKEVSIPYWFD